MGHHLRDNHLLSDMQHGFIRGHSTCTNLFESMNDWTLSVTSKTGISVAYIDFSRAFDSVTHVKLFARLHSYGIQGDLLRWLTEFFTGCTHQTRVGLSSSNVAELLSGVVQGSGIGPVLFLIYIDDLPSCLRVMVL